MSTVFDYMDFFNHQYCAGSHIVKYVSFFLGGFESRVGRFMQYVWLPA